MVRSENTATFEDFVLTRTSSNNSYQTFSLVEIIDSGDFLIEFPAYLVLNDYFDELKEAAVEVKLSSAEYIKYRYRPKLLAYDVYNNTELAFLILMVNEMMNVKEFDLQSYTLKMIPKKRLTEIMTNIKSAESSFIESYNTAARGDN